MHPVPGYTRYLFLVSHIGLCIWVSVMVICPVQCGYDDGR